MYERESHKQSNGNISNVTLARDDSQQVQTHRIFSPKNTLKAPLKKKKDKTRLISIVSKPIKL